MKREEIEAALDEWVNETAIDPHTGAPFVVGGLEIANYNTFLIGHTPTGDPPTSGRRSHHFDLRFLLTPQESRETSQSMVERLQAAAVDDPELGGRLPYGTRLDLGPADFTEKEPRNRRGGPVVVLRATVAGLELGPDGDDEAQ